MDSSPNKVFPISNDSACVFKWAWNTFRLYNGKSSSCHRVKPELVEIDNFENFHNMPEVLRDRALMKQNIWPDADRGCEYCRRIEHVGGISDRLHHNQIPGLTPLDFDQSVDNRVTPRILEVYLDNTCDLACVYCTPSFSSRINSELMKFGPYPIGVKATSRHPDREMYFTKYKQWLVTNSDKILRISILGGEPLLQKEFWELLELIEQMNQPLLELSINTNLNADIDTVTRLTDKIKSMLGLRKIARFRLIASLDCWGPQAEFIRHGLSLDRWKQNFEYIMQHRWINLSVHQVITSLSLWSMGNLQKLVADYKKHYPKIIQSYHMVDSGQELIYHPEIFGADLFNDTFQHLVETFPVATEWDHECKNRLIGFQNYQKKSHIEPERLSLLKKTLDEIDRRRHTDWKTLFPGIDEFFTRNGI